MNDAELIAQAEMSPCVGVCKLDEASGWCFGCGRTDGEIENWQNLDTSVREALEADLPGRVEQLLAERRAKRAARGGARGRKRA
ncbi:DUF1289 domain-containing protein [Motiliproteus sp. MSK22-1]|uniref:DUF1289 domain-containing protein n=1 Tax=Motiliproteus sp. MSK22-1 TaxID=1897630 RepID=UPI000978B2D5|nr:DUF1289 domain-containing protein [Motiliproteus sp. MSK22-1]OMH37529.1 hypothetical protein BGP75_09130 [Motiliproteus sp. MSK22-1]